MHSSLQKLKRFEEVNEEEKEKILKILRERFGVKKFNYFILKSGKNIWICSKDIKNFDISELNVMAIGLEFATLKNFFRIKFSAVSLLKARKNAIELNGEEFLKWLKGEVFEKDLRDGIYLLEFRNKLVGCTLVQNKKILNFVPKHRRILDARQKYL